MGLDIYLEKLHKEQIGYFRKVNFLVKFFADRGFDVENQIPLEITKDMVAVLIDRCDLVLKEHTLAPKLLPTMSGFFFGSVEYDDDYFNDVKAVKEYCEKELLPEFSTLSSDEYIQFATWY